VTGFNRNSRPNSVEYAGIEQFMEERFRIAARGTAREACVYEPAGGIDGGEVHAGASRVTAFVQRVDLNVLSSDQTPFFGLGTMWGWGVG